MFSQMVAAGWLRVCPLLGHLTGPGGFKVNLENAQTQNEMRDE